MMYKKQIIAALIFSAVVGLTQRKMPALIAKQE